MEKFAIIVAAGSGTRMGGAIPKQFLLLKGKPLIWYSVKAFQEAFEDIKIILVLQEQQMAMGRELLEMTGGANGIRLIVGGHKRFDSVKNGLEYVIDPAIVFVHDGVRCLVSPSLIRRCYEAAILMGTAVPAINSQDSIRIETNGSNHAIDRDKVKIIQTPQTFRSDILKNAFRQEYLNSFTDESAVIEHFGIPIHLVEGDPSNIKITLPLDLIIAEKMLL